jgi:integrase
MAKLTDLKIRNAKPADKRYALSDNGSGLWLVVQPSGYRSYVTWVRLKSGRQIKITHGDATALSLADARVLNTKAIQQAKQGNDPRAAKKEARAKRVIAEANTFEAVALLYLNTDKVKKLRTVDQLTYRLTRLTIPQIGDKPIADLKRSQITAALDHIERVNGGRTADLCLSDISCVLHYHAKRSDDYVPPLVKGMNRTTAKDLARDRILTDDEIRAVWNTGNAFARFLLLTAARRDEAASMQWKELDGNDWTLPASRNKVKVDLVRPLSKAAMAELPRREGEFVFGSPPDRPLRSYSFLKASLDEASGVTGWRFHDLRRTARTLLSRAGVNADHAERCLGHVIGGVRGTYDRHEFKDEKARALEALAHQLAAITNPPTGDVADINEEREKREKHKAPKRRRA